MVGLNRDEVISSLSWFFSKKLSLYFLRINKTLLGVDIPIYNETSDKKFGMSTPNNVLLIRKKYKDSFFKGNQLSDGITSSLFNPNFSIAFFSVGIPCVSNPGMNGVSNPFKFLYLTIVSFKILFKACPM